MSLKKPKITWDEEVIAEHDKERGTRQKIDEPNTPFHYVPADDDENDANGTDQPRRSSFTSPPTSAEVGKGGAGAAADATLSVFDNWERVHAKLALHQAHQQEQDAHHAPSSSNGNGAVARAAGDGAAMDVDDGPGSSATSSSSASSSSVLRKDTSRWAQPPAAPRPATNDTSPVAMDQPVTEASAPSDGAESDGFKAKRAAHYNEFKLSKLVVQPDDDYVVLVTALAD